MKKTLIVKNLIGREGKKAWRNNHSWLPSTFTRLTENEREIFVKNYRWLLEIKYENTNDNGFITMKIREKGESILGIKIIRCIQFFVENSIRAHHLTYRAPFAY